MCLEQGIASEELHDDTTYAPDVTGKTPTELQYDLRCTIMPCRNNRGMIFVIECGRAEVNESNFTI